MLPVSGAERGEPGARRCSRQEFVTFCANAQTQALQAPHISYGPVNPNAYEHIDAERAKVLSTALLQSLTELVNCPSDLARGVGI